MTSQFLRKITVKSIGCNSNVGKDKAVDICEVWGIVTSLTPGSSPLGEYVKLNGNFGAYNLQEDREFNSNHAILPAIASDLISEGFMASGGEFLQFAVRIGVEPSDSPIRYSYTLDSLAKIDELPAMVGLRKTVDETRRSRSTEKLELPKATPRKTLKPTEVPDEVVD